MCVGKLIFHNNLMKQGHTVISFLNKLMDNKILGSLSLSAKSLHLNPGLQTLEPSLGLFIGMSVQLRVASFN